MLSYSRLIELFYNFLTMYIIHFILGTFKLCMQCGSWEYHQDVK